MPAKPIIVIRFFGGDEPKVELPEGLEAQIQFIDQDNQDTLILTHNRVSVYQAIKEFDRGNFQESSHMYAVEPMTWEENDTAFDVDELPDPPEHLACKYEALFPESPMKRKLVYLIDIKVITQEDGLTLNFCDECDCAIAFPDDSGTESLLQYHQQHCSLYLVPKAPAEPEQDGHHGQQ